MTPDLRRSRSIQGLRPRPYSQREGISRPEPGLPLGGQPSGERSSRLGLLPEEEAGAGHSISLTGIVPSPSLPRKGGKRSREGLMVRRSRTSGDILFLGPPPVFHRWGPTSFPEGKGVVPSDLQGLTAPPKGCCPERQGGTLPSRILRSFCRSIGTFPSLWDPEGSLPQGLLLDSPRGGG
jgi:hypothetical protein